MPGHAARMVPDSERITTDVRALEAAFDPAQPLTYEVEYEALPDVKWRAPYADIQVVVPDNGALVVCLLGCLFWLCLCARDNTNRHSPTNKPKK